MQSLLYRVEQKAEDVDKIEKKGWELVNCDMAFKCKRCGLKFWVSHIDENRVNFCPSCGALLKEAEE